MRQSRVFFVFALITAVSAVCLAGPVHAGMIIKLDDGRTIRVDVDRNQIESITFRDSGAPAPPPSTGGITFDFETGDLRGWTKTGDSFDYQPTYGDNPTARHRGQPSKHQGSYWIGTYEKRPNPSSPAGKVQGDGPEGTLTSKSFTIYSNSISFLVGGGCDINTERVELLVDGQVVLQATGKCTETMHRVRWNVSPWRGRSARIRLVDQSSGGWGHINFDDLRFE
jgi:hypothetical protein